MSNIARTLVVLSALFVTGAPVAACLARNRSEWTRFLFESCAIGLIAQVAIAIGLMRADHFTRLGVATMTGIVIGGGLAAGGWRLFRRLPEADLRWLLALLGLLVLAMALRTHASNFIFEIGDMGEYVNSANRAALSGNLLQSFPHGFTMYLAATNLWFGPAHTVDGLSALGVILVLGTVSCAKALGLRAVAAFGAGLIVVVHPMTVWFSTFPVSETLYATFLVASLYFFMQARAQSSHAYGVVSGLAFGLLLLTRGNAMLLAPILVVVLIVSAGFDDDRTYRVQRTTTVGGLVSLAIAYAYNVRYVTSYFVTKQLHEFVPNIAYRAAHRLHLLEWSWWLLSALVFGAGVVVLVAHLVRVLLAPRLESTTTRFFQISNGLVVVGALVVLAAVGAGGLGDALIRWGPVVLGLAIVEVVLMIARPGRHIDATTGLFVLLGIATFSILYAVRLPSARAAPFYLYWDRYLFSEVFPLVIVVVAIALHALVDAFAPREAPGAGRARAMAAIALGAGLLAMLPALAETRRVTRYTVLGDAYGVVSYLDRSTRISGTRATIVYSGLEAMPQYWSSPDTLRSFALPLVQTFGRHVVGVASDTHHTDPQYDPAGARAVLAQKGQRRGFLVDVRDPGGTPFPDDARTHYVGSIDYRAPIIARRVDRARERYHVVTFVLDVYALDANS